MGLILSFEIKESASRKFLTAIENTGAHDTNFPNSWGAPNPATSDVDTVVLIAAKRNEDGTYTTNPQYDGFSILPSAVIGKKEDVTAEQLGYGTNAVFEDGIYKFTYGVSGTFEDNPFSYTKEITKIFTGNIRCCLLKMLVKNCECLCKNEELKCIIIQFALLLLAIKEYEEYSVDNLDQIQGYIDFLKKKCEQSDCKCN